MAGGSGGSLLGDVFDSAAEGEDELTGPQLEKVGGLGVGFREKWLRGGLRFFFTQLPRPRAYDMASES